MEILRTFGRVAFVLGIIYGAAILYLYWLTRRRIEDQATLDEAHWIVEREYRRLEDYPR